MKIITLLITLFASTSLFGEGKFKADLDAELVAGRYKSAEDYKKIGHPLVITHRDVFDVITIKSSQRLWGRSYKWKYAPEEIEIRRDPKTGIYSGSAQVTLSSKCDFKYEIDIAPLKVGFGFREKYPLDATRRRDGECVFHNFNWRYHDGIYKIIEEDIPNLYRKLILNAENEGDKKQLEFDFAAYTGDLKTVELLIDQVDINLKNWRGFSPITSAATTGQADVVAKLIPLVNLADIKAYQQASNGYTQYRNNEERRLDFASTMKLLVFAKQAPKSWAGDYVTWQSKDGNGTIQEILQSITQLQIPVSSLEALVPLSFGWYSRANDNLKSQYLAVIDELSQKEEIPKAVWTKSIEDKYNPDTCVMRKWGDNSFQSLFRVLIDRQVMSQNLLNRYMVSTMRCSVDDLAEVYSYLLEAGGDINYRDAKDNNYTSLYYAVKMLSADWIDYLLSSGASFDIRIGKNETHVIVALVNIDFRDSYDEIISILDHLLEKGVDLNVKNNNDFNLLDFQLYQIYGYTRRFSSKSCSDRRHRNMIHFYHELEKRGLTHSGASDEIVNHHSREFGMSLCD